MKEIENRMRPKVRYWLPAAAVDEADLREEVRRLSARGFGGIEAVVLNSGLGDIPETEDGWGTENWEQVMNVLADEAEKLGMSVDFAVSPEWPISAPSIKSADDPAALYELTYGTADAGKGGHFCGKLPERRKKHEEGSVKLVSVMAYRETEPDSHVLVQDSYTDLAPFVSESGEGAESAILSCDLPLLAEGRWLIFAFYGQPACQKKNNGQYYVISHLNREGAEACGKYWEKEFAKNPYPAMESFFCDSLEYEVALEWTPDFPREFETRRGYSILPYLPFVGLVGTYPADDVPGYHFEDPEISDSINRDYLETITACYCEYHLAGIRDLAHRFGKTVRYQVAYNKPFEEERCGLYVDIPENEALGRAAGDGLKAMAAAAHLDRKERYSFECAAEFGHSYGQDYEDLFWWAKRALMAGMNAEVLHGASYSGAYHGVRSAEGKIPGAAWPGYETFGKAISNYWNRTPSEQHARGCLDALSRMNAVFRGKARVDCAILRNEYLNDGSGSEFCFFQDGGALSDHGYSYEFVTDALLSHPNAIVGEKNGRCVLDPEGAAWKCVILDGNERLSTEGLRRLAGFMEDGLPVLLAGEDRIRPAFYSEVCTPEKKKEWEEARESFRSGPALLRCGSAAEATGCLLENGIDPEVRLAGDMHLATAVREGEEAGETWYALYGYNCVEYGPGDPTHEEMLVSANFKKGTTKGTYRRPGPVSRKTVSVQLPGEGEVFLYNPWDGRERPLPFVRTEGGMTVEAGIEEDELLLLHVVPAEMAEDGATADAGSTPACDAPAAESASAPAEAGTIRVETLSLYPFEPEREGETSFLRSGFGEKTAELFLGELKAWKDLREDLLHFSGMGVYEGFLDVKEAEPGANYILELGDVCDTFRVFVNGVEAPFPDQVMKRVDLTGLLKVGRNELRIEVVSNLYNCLFDENTNIMGIPIPFYPRKYGIMDADDRKLRLIRC